MKARRMLSSILAAALVLALGGCGRAMHAHDITDTPGSITIGGIERTYVIHLPGGSTPTHLVPLIIVLHGYQQTGGDMAELTGFNALADTNGFIVVYPNGLEQSWADRNNTYADRAGVDDVAFIGALIDQLVSAYPVDRARVYATGFSNGGFMASVLGCALPDKLAAVAPVAATMPVSLVPQCLPGRPVSLLLIHGQDDTSAPPAGGKIDAQGGVLGLVLSDADTVAFWADHDGCQSVPLATDLPLPVNDGTRLQQTNYMGCSENAAVQYDAIAGAGHVWPGGPHDAGKYFDASAAIWSFFAAHPPLEKPVAPRGAPE